MILMVVLLSSFQHISYKEREGRENVKIIEYNAFSSIIMLVLLTHAGYLSGANMHIHVRQQ